jgi:hypothetical protein
MTVIRPAPKAGTLSRYFPDALADRLIIQLRIRPIMPGKFRHTGQPAGSPHPDIEFIDDRLNLSQLVADLRFPSIIIFMQRGCTLVADDFLAPPVLPLELPVPPQLQEASSRHISASSKKTTAG